MKVQEAKIEFKKYQKKLSAYSHAIGMLHYDSETCMPSGASENLGETLGILSEDIYKMQVSNELAQTLKVLKENENELDPQTKKEMQEVLREKEKTEKIPMDEFVDYQICLNAAQQAWQKAKGESNYECFKPHLGKIIEYQKKFAKYIKPDETNIYNIMLDDYERGMTTDMLDDYFAKLRAAIVPLIEKIKSAPAPNVDFMSHKYPIATQRVLSDYLLDVLNIDKNHCVIGETEHPFSTHFSKNDVRVTTHYQEDSIASSFYSIIHECGHGMYELCTSDDLIGSVLASGTSMGIHESQSRFWENIVGRSLEFCELVFPKLQELFPEQLKNVTATDFYKAVNKSEPSLIRIEADELTYSIHIMVRYEIEKRIFANELTVEELPSAWNALYKEYLGVDVPDDAHGVLQDVHWSGGMFGYFPSYSVGSAYASQITASMQKDIDVKKLVASGDMAPIADWLTEHIYKYGSMLTPPEVIKNCCGVEFDPTYYVEYLTEKYSKLYSL